MAYMGFKKLQNKLRSKGYSKKASGAITASIGRKKYGKVKMAKAAKTGTSLRRDAANSMKQKLDY